MVFCKETKTKQLLSSEFEEPTRNWRKQAKNALGWILVGPDPGQL